MSAAEQLAALRRRRHAMTGNVRRQSALVTRRAIEMILERPAVQGTLAPCAEQPASERDAETVRLIRALLRGEVGLTVSPVVSEQIIVGTGERVQRYHWTLIDQNCKPVAELGQSEIPT